MVEKAITDFLYGTFGYRKIDELNRGLKPQNTHQRAYLDGTILGTFGRRSSPALGDIIWSRANARVPHIFSADEIEEQIRAGKSYLDELFGENILRPEIEKRKFFLSSYASFVGYTANNVKARMRQIHEEKFPHAGFEFSVRGRFRGSISQEDFYFFTEGSTSRSGAKLIVLAFNVGSEIVEDLNSIAAKNSAINHQDR